MRKVVCVLLLLVLFINVSPVYAMPFYGVNKSYPVWNKIGQWFNNEIKFEFKFGWDVNKINYANKRMKCIKCKKKISMDLYAFTRGYCENCYKGDKKAIKHFLAGKALLDKENSKVRNMNDYKVNTLSGMTVGILGVMYSMKNTVVGMVR